MPDTVHTEGVVELKATVNPEVALAATANGTSRMFLVAKAPKLMLCACMDGDTVNDCVTAGAGVYVELPT